MHARWKEFRVAPAVLRQHLAAGEGYVAIARLYDVGEHADRRRCCKLGLRELVNGRTSNETALRMAVSRSDISIKRIAGAFGVEGRTIWAAARSYGLPNDQRGREAREDTR
ncbi:hypothetical protein MTDSW087_05191 [Methylobacterium dankookense]|uniref:Uncharacterized protein n=1 Tax=Methylobacterium dankookense TaxID=560405 RepID=A0A564G7D7_9HYPH|nr:hypothetical protein IFDJLNFL_4956 [Methylobacterium dankookense]VUF15451.1 hypothetical protein MTDSW087_05191 [Methylobacterium dankookense]